MKRRSLLLVASLSATLMLCLGFALDTEVVRAPAYRTLSLFAEVIGLVRGNYVDEVDQQSLLRGAYQGMLEGLDPYSGYLSPEEFRALSKQSESPAGIGVDVIKAGGSVVIVAVLPKSPAEGAALGVGDQIWYIDGKSTREMSLLQVLHLLAGADGSDVGLQLYRIVDQKRAEVHLKRETPKAPPFESRIESGDIGYVRLRDPQRATRSALSAALSDLQKRGARRLLLDLRGATGGGMEDAERIAGLFVGDATIARTRERDGVEKDQASKGPVLWKQPSWLLVNGGTAGAAEIIAGALRDLAKAKLLGDRTCGFGARQELIPLPAGDGLVLSTTKYLTPSGETWYGTGLKVDIALPLGPEDKPAEAEEKQLRRALEIVEKDGAELARAA